MSAQKASAKRSANPWVVSCLLLTAVGVWLWNGRLLYQQRPNTGAPASADLELPEVVHIQQDLAALPALERDPFMAPQAEVVEVAPVQAQPEVNIPQQPMPPRPPQGVLQMVLKRQDGYAAIFKFGNQEPEVLVVGDIYMTWQVTAITLNQVSWHHEPSESDYVSRIP